MAGQKARSAVLLKTFRPSTSCLSANKRDVDARHKAGHDELVARMSGAKCGCSFEGFPGCRFAHPGYACCHYLLNDHKPPFIGNFDVFVGEKRFDIDLI